ncbi:GDP-mannose 4,6 dehydratase [Halothiobacillus diazotrophicus]|uniref:GDP-mannose 4,6 dehydratase n=1 Tax=Halothiobacillus diazotrophicus TaxID=1860122 RepID=A0A191ZFE8_9GAMM|nr:GDP-mannose 4,6-dehydratase [Halothiobacillus diazotrophicus]ANJ66593.1 GDP-mannose 4,6 dehydratase [Halothiobacillus diazotrophicus]
MKALITGVQGFTGRYLAAELSQAGYEVHGLAQSPSGRAIPGVHAVHAGDLADLAALTHIMETVRPDIVVHLAAIAFVAHGDVSAIYSTNLMGSRNVLDALVRAKVTPRAVLIASSANVYGNATGGMLSEATLPAPANDYAVSKLAMEFMANLFQDKLPLIVTRPFNYTGVGQTENFLLPKIVAHVRKKAPVIELGNLDVARDFSDVRTVVQCYRRLLEKPEAIGGTFNVCSGKAFTLQEVLDMVRSISGHDFEVRVNPAFVRANEVKMLLGDRAKLVSMIGPVDDIPLADTLRWMIESPEQ